MLFRSRDAAHRGGRVTSAPNADAGGGGGNGLLLDPVLDDQRRSADTLAPPSAPVSGDRYIVPAGATGAWSGHANEVAEWDGSAWGFTAPIVGNLVYAEKRMEYLQFISTLESSIEPLGPSRILTSENAVTPDGASVTYTLMGLLNGVETKLEVNDGIQIYVDGVLTYGDTLTDTTHLIDPNEEVTLQNGSVLRIVGFQNVNFGWVIWPDGADLSNPGSVVLKNNSTGAYTTLELPPFAVFNGFWPELGNEPEKFVYDQSFRIFTDPSTAEQKGVWLPLSIASSLHPDGPSNLGLLISTIQEPSVWDDYPIYSKWAVPSPTSSEKGALSGMVAIKVHTDAGEDYLYHRPIVGSIAYSYEAGTFYAWDGGVWVPLTKLLSLEQMQNVYVSSPVNGQTLAYDGGTWINTSTGGGSPHALNDHTDTNLGTPGSGQNGYYVGWDNGTSKYTLKPIPSTSLAFDDLTDVDMTGVTAGDLVQFDGTNYVPYTPTGGSPHALGTHTDTTFTSVTNGDVVYRSGGVWVNSPLSALTAHNHTFDSLSNVNMTGKVANSSVPRWNGSSWVPWTPVLSGLGDVAISGPTNGQALIYDSATSKWKNGSPTAAITWRGVMATIASFTLSSGGTSAVGTSPQTMTQQEISSASLLTSNTRFQADVTGKWKLTVTGNFTASNTSRTSVFIRANGSGSAYKSSAATQADCTNGSGQYAAENFCVSGIFQLTASSGYLEVMVTASAGFGVANLNILWEYVGS